MNTPTYGLIGRGRVAAHMTHYLETENRAVVTWHRGGGVAVGRALAPADVVLLAVSDDAVETVLRDNPVLGDRPVVHFSGSLVVEGAVGMHPLMTFGPDLYDLDTYRAIPFITDRGGSSFGELFSGLVNPTWAIEPELKPLYHALCVIAGNFTTLSWVKAMEDFETRLGLPASALRPFLEQTAANTLERGADALTGTLARGDSGTLHRDLRALAGDPYREVYLAYSRSIAGKEATS